MQRLAECIQAKRLHMILNIGIGTGRVAARESAELRGRHAHRAAAGDQILQGDFCFSPCIARQRIERLDAIHLEYSAYL